MPSGLPDPRQPSEHWPVAWWLQAYSGGWFPMAEAASARGLRLFRSRERALLPLDQRFTIPRSVRRALRPTQAQARFTPSLNRAFERVLAGCADRPNTWISPELARIYAQLHSAGVAHSVELWEEGELAAGLLAIGVGACWIGESMAHWRPEAGNALLVQLVQGLRQGGFALFDIQLSNPHLERFGCFQLTDDAYEIALRQARQRPAQLRLGDDAITSEAWMRE